MTEPAGDWRLGATPVPGATRFEVWAPHAANVDVEIALGDTTTVVALEPGATARGSTTGWTWRATVGGVGAGARYRYRIDRGDWLPDPASRLQPDGVHGASEIVDRVSFEWSDADWNGVALADAVLYELHVGTFTAAGTLWSAIDELPRLAALGITMVELMPVAAFPGERNWGYDGVFPFAVQASYGGPAALAAFVDAAHRLALGVVLDVVYNHFGPEGNIVPRFGPYLTDAYRTPWGSAVNVAERHSDAVRRYFMENATGWITDFHLDGLRLDAVHAIFDPTAVPFVAELTAAVHAAADKAGRRALVTIESSANDPQIVRPTAAHGWGCDAVWNDDFHHTLRVALTGERHEYYAGYDGVADLARAWNDRFVYTGQHSPVMGRRHGASAAALDHRQFVVFAQNHDHVGNTPAGDRLLAGHPDRERRLRLAAATVLLSPFTPMLFMGEEYGETAPFPYFIDHGDPQLVEAVRAGRTAEFAGHDWSGGVADPAAPETFRRAVLQPDPVGREPHRRFLAMYTDLLRIRRATQVLTDPAAAQTVERDGDTITIVRAAPELGRTTLVLNFGDDDVNPAAEPATAVLFDSSDPRWGGDSAGRQSPATRPPVPPWSARLLHAEPAT